MPVGHHEKHVRQNDLLFLVPGGPQLSKLFWNFLRSERLNLVSAGDFMWFQRGLHCAVTSAMVLPLPFSVGGFPERCRTLKLEKR